MLTVIKINAKCFDVGPDEQNDNIEISEGYSISNPTRLRFYTDESDSKPEVHIRAEGGYEFKMPDPHYEYSGSGEYFDIKIVSIDPPTWIMSESYKITSSRELRSMIIEEIIDIIKEADKKKSKVGTYNKGDKKSLMLDRPTQHGGWPEGEYDPPINQKIYDYLKSLGLVESIYKEEDSEIIKSFIREIILV